MYSSGIRMWVVYIEEAHAEDEWPIGAAVKIKQHRDIAHRAAAVKRIKVERDLQVPVVMDNMENTFGSYFKPWPIQFYIFQNGKLQWVADPESGTFSLTQVKEEYWKRV